MKLIEIYKNYVFYLIQHNLDCFKILNNKAEYHIYQI